MPLMLFPLSRSKLTNESSFAVLIVPSNAATSVIVVVATSLLRFVVNFGKVKYPVRGSKLNNYKRL